MRSGNSMLISVFLAASFRLMIEAAPMAFELFRLQFMLTPLRHLVMNLEDCDSASRIRRYSAARRCFLVISSSFTGRFLSYFSTSFEEA